MASDSPSLSPFSLTGFHRFWESIKKVNAQQSSYNPNVALNWTGLRWRLCVFVRARVFVHVCVWEGFRRYLLTCDIGWLVWHTLRRPHLLRRECHLQTILIRPLIVETAIQGWRGRSHLRRSCVSGKGYFADLCFTSTAIYATKHRFLSTFNSGYVFYIYR